MSFCPSGVEVFEKLNRLGQGSYGTAAWICFGVAFQQPAGVAPLEVYRARDTENGEIVALKKA